uniref:phosphoethanolamine N-methyltransferase n=1 Tax=Heterorhabditis bacteriophora TaxID=37862 RepID=A0A1I7X0X5_HETBA
MPATEKQLVTEFRRALRTESNWNIVIVSGEGDDIANTALVAEFSGLGQVSIHKSLCSIKSLSNIDALLINGVIGEIINNHDALDAFVKETLHAMKDGGVVIIRQDLSKYILPVHAVYLITTLLSAPFHDSKKVAKLTDYFDVFRTEINGRNTGFQFYGVNEVEDSIYVDLFYIAFEFVLYKYFHAEISSTRRNIQTLVFTHMNGFLGTISYLLVRGYAQNLSIIKRFGDMKAGQTMLDIGVGIGGGARQVAKEYGVHVTGIDLSSNMLAVALDRVQRDKDTRVKYSICDALVYNFEPNSFDYVFSRDCIQHISDTEALFKIIYNALKPGGKVLITMYGVGYGELSESFKSYVAHRNYFLKNLKQIYEVVSIAHKVGFSNIVTENMTGRFKEILDEERSRVENNKEEFLQKFSQKEYDSLVNGWNSKLQYIADDNHNWNLFLTEKPFVQ